VRKPVYLDYAASTPVDPAVADQMDHCLRAPALAANPAAGGHGPGRAAAALVEAARGEVAGLINAAPAEIIFTSGATESDNLAILGAARFLAARGRHLVTSLVEHKAVVESCRHLAANGWRVTWLAPDADGRIDTSAVEAALRPDTVLVSLMHVNNETGVRQDIAALGTLCRRRDVLLHVDAAQSAGREVLDVRAAQIDLLSLSGHKIYGPKGIGALFLDRERVRRIAPLFFGGGQERGLRPGTVPTHQVAGLGTAFRLAAARREDECRHARGLRDRLWEQLSDLPGVLLNGHGEQRAPHILNVSVEGVQGESLFLALKDLAVASGSACTSLSGEPSHVLRSLGRSSALAEASVRFSFGRPTTADEVDFAAATFRQAVGRLRRIAPADGPRARRATA
jgi:cysteine desulfurase